MLGKRVLFYPISKTMCSKNIFIFQQKNCTFQCNFRKIRLDKRYVYTVTTVRNEILEGTDRIVSDLVVILERETFFR